MGRLSRCVCTVVLAGEDAAFSSLSSLLALRTSTAVGEEAVVKAASFGACEPSGRGETDCSTDGLTKSGVVVADCTLPGLDSFAVATCFAGCSSCVATYRTANANKAPANRIAALQMTSFLRGRVSAADAVGSATFCRPPECGAT